MSRLTLIILTAIIMLLMISPIQAPAAVITRAETDASPVLNDIVADFQLLASVWEGAAPYGDYLLTARFGDLESAALYLGAGFEPDLARDLAAFLLTYDPQTGRMAVIPAEFIPMLGTTDLPYLQVEHSSPETVVVSRCYDDCYRPGDRYIYTITARCYEGHWKIAGFTLVPADDSS